VQEESLNNMVQVVIATVAFGMGIDLVHVYYVIHWTMAKTIKGFNQELGRG
jgi:superfamily II DNA helicase RecQ